MNIWKTVKLLAMIATYKMNVEKIANYTEQQFGRGVSMKVMDHIREMNINNDGSVDLIEAALYVVRKFKK